MLLQLDHTSVMPGLVPGIHLLLQCQERRGWPGITAFTRVFDALRPAMTMWQGSILKSAPHEFTP
jgi:hypothetical protein